MARKLQKSKNRMLVGVAGGIADYFRIDPVIVRAIFILLVFANGLGILLYILLALLMPKAEATSAGPLAVVKENLKTAPQDAKEAGRRGVHGHAQVASLRKSEDGRGQHGRGPAEKAGHTPAPVLCCSPEWPSQRFPRSPTRNGHPWWSPCWRSSRCNTSRFRR